MSKMINKSCKTCESNFSGKCATEGHYGYGGKIDDFETQRSCWTIGHDYFIELLETLPERTQQEIQRGLKSFSSYFDIE